MITTSIAAIAYVRTRAPLRALRAVQANGTRIAWDDTIRAWRRALATTFETLDAMQAFRVAARRARVLINATAHGEQNELLVYTAIDRLDRRCVKPEIRGNSRARLEAWETITRLREAMREAVEDGAKAREAARKREDDAYREQVRAYERSKPR